jgi:hypothetical protein
MFPAAFKPFIQQRPVGVMARAVVERFFEPEHLDALFRRTAVKQYERELLFQAQRFAAVSSALNAVTALLKQATHRFASICIIFNDQDSKVHGCLLRGIEANSVPA